MRRYRSWFPEYSPRTTHCKVPSATAKKAARLCAHGLERDNVPQCTSMSYNGLTRWQSRRGWALADKLTEAVLRWCSMSADHHGVGEKRSYMTREHKALLLSPSKKRNSARLGTKTAGLVLCKPVNTEQPVDVGSGGSRSTGIAPSIFSVLARRSAAGLRCGRQCR
jgi:hypothetical protein